MKFVLIKIKNDNKITGYLCKIQRGQKSSSPARSHAAEGASGVGEVFSARQLEKQKECALPARTFTKTKILIYEFYLKILYFLIILFNKPKESFEILKEELEEKNGKVVKVIINRRGKKEELNMEEIFMLMKRKSIKNYNILEELLQKLFQLHKQKQKKIKAVSFATLAIVVITTVISSLTLTTMFPNVFNTNAATYTYTQTDWSGGASETTTGHPAPADWDKFTESTNIDYSTEGEVKLAAGEDDYSETFDATTYKDTDNTTANWNTTSGQVEFPTESMGVDLREELNGILGGYNINAQVIDGDDVYTGAIGGRFIKYNTTTDEVTDLTSKISSFWSTNSISSLSFDPTNNVIYLGGQYGKFARYNTASYTGGGTYPDADTAYDLTSKISSFWSTNYIYTFTFDSANNVIYFGGYNGKFARYNTTSYTAGGAYPDADTAYDLTSKISSFWGTNYIYSLVFDVDDRIIYIGGGISECKFARYNSDSYTAGGTYPDADTAYDLSSKFSTIFTVSENIKSLIFDSEHEVIYVGGGYSRGTGAPKFARYNSDSYTAGGTYPTADTGYDLSSKISSQLGINPINKLSPSGALAKNQCLL